MLQEINRIYKKRKIEMESTFSGAGFLSSTLIETYRNNIKMQDEEIVICDARYFDEFSGIYYKSSISVDVAEGVILASASVVEVHHPAASLSGPLVLREHEAIALSEWLISRAGREYGTLHYALSDEYSE